MFLFQRERPGSPEVFAIYLAPRTLPNDRQRFGTPLHPNMRREVYFSVGNLVLIHAIEETDFFLFTHQALTEDERNALIVELELLVGREVHAWGAEWEQGWLLHDALKDFDFRSRS